MPGRTITQTHWVDEEQDKDKGDCSSSRLLPRPNLPELNIVESVKNKAQSFSLQSLVQLEALATGMRLLPHHTHAVMPKSISHHHLHLFF